jgi:hypothetical protein
MSYWWLAWSVFPMLATDEGGRWLGLDVCGQYWNGWWCGM